MKRNILVFGLIAGIIITAMMVGSSIACYKNSDFEGSMLLGYAGMLLAFSMIFVGIKNYRDKYNGGTITFGQAFKLGSAIALIASTIYVGVWLIEYYMFIPDFMDKYSAHMLTQAQKSGVSGAEYADKVTEINKMKEWYKNPAWVILLTYAEVFPLGLVVTLICALILKRKHNPKQVATI